MYCLKTSDAFVTHGFTDFQSFVEWIFTISNLLNFHNSAYITYGNFLFIHHQFLCLMNVHDLFRINRNKIHSIIFLIVFLLCEGINQCIDVIIRIDLWTFISADSCIVWVSLGRVAINRDVHWINTLNLSYQYLDCNNLTSQPFIDYSHYYLIKIYPIIYPIYIRVKNSNVYGVSMIWLRCITMRT